MVVSFVVVRKEVIYDIRMMRKVHNKMNKLSVEIHNKKIRVMMHGRIIKNMKI